MLKVLRMDPAVDGPTFTAHYKDDQDEHHYEYGTPMGLMGVTNMNV